MTSPIYRWKSTATFVCTTMQMSSDIQEIHQTYKSATLWLSSNIHRHLSHNRRGNCCNWQM